MKYLFVLLTYKAAFFQHSNIYFLGPAPAEWINNDQIVWLLYEILFIDDESAILLFEIMVASHYVYNIFNSLQCKKTHIFQQKHKRDELIVCWVQI